jgi:hypothetical protein
VVLDVAGKGQDRGELGDAGWGGAERAGQTGLTQVGEGDDAREKGLTLEGEGQDVWGKRVDAGGGGDRRRGSGECSSGWHTRVCRALTARQPR